MTTTFAVVLEIQTARQTRMTGVCLAWGMVTGIFDGVASGDRVGRR
jgi:hypothetical protein